MAAIHESAVKNGSPRSRSFTCKDLQRFVSGDATRSTMFEGKVAAGQGEAALGMERGNFRRRRSHCHSSSLCRPLPCCYLTTKRGASRGIPVREAERVGDSDTNEA